MLSFPALTTKWAVVRRVAATAIALSISAGTSSSAQPQPPGPDPVYEVVGFKPGRDFYSPLPFEHIDTINGNVLLKFSDLTLPGNGGFNLTFGRSINLKMNSGPSENGLGKPLQWGLDGLPLVVRRATPHTVPDTSPVEYRMPTFQTYDGANHPTRWVEVGDFGSSDVVMTREFWRYTISERKLELPNGLVLNYGLVLPGIGPGVDGFLTSVTDPFGNVVVTTEWTGGRLVKVRHHLGLDDGNPQIREVHLGYAEGAASLPSLSHPTSMTYQDRLWTYTLEPVFGRYPTTVQPPAGPAWTFGGDPFTVTTPNGGKVKYSFESFLMRSGRITERPNSGFTSRSMIGQRTTEEKNSEGQYVPTGTWNFAWTDPSPLLTEVTISGPVRTVKYENSWVGSQGGPVTHKRTVTSGGVTVETETLTYSGFPLLRGTTNEFPEDVEVLEKREIERDGRTFTTNYSYSSANFKDYLRPNEITETGHLSRTTSITYQHGFANYIRARVESATVSVGGEAYERSYGLDLSNGFVTGRTVYGVTTSYGNDGRGNVGSATDANTNTTSFLYSWGVPRVVNTPKFTISREINEDGTIHKEIRRGHETLFGYDGLGRVTSIDPPEGNTTIIDYDTNGGSVTQSRAADYFVHTTLDGFGRPVATEDGAGVKTKTSYDVEGRRTFQSYPYTGLTDSGGDEFTYDALNRLRQVEHADLWLLTRQYSTDGTGTVTIVDEKNRTIDPRTTIQYWHAFGDPDEVRLVGVIDAHGEPWSYTYTTLGALKTVDGPGTIPDRIWSYNSKHQLESETHPESGTTHYTYWPAGNLKTKDDANLQHFFFWYDGNNRLIEIRPGASESPEIVYDYDDSDNRFLMQNGTITSHFEFDGANRPTKRRDAIGGAELVTSYHYSGVDVLTAIDYPSGRRVDFGPGSQGRITAVTGPSNVTYASNIQYHPTGAISSFTFGNGATENVEFDHPRQWPTRIVSGPLDVGYVYDEVGNVTETNDARPGFSSGFGYDKLDRLEAVAFYGARDYTYDAAGNRKTSKYGGFTYGYTYDDSKQRLIGSEDVPMDGGFLYYDNGNTKADRMGTYKYTRFNMLEEATVTTPMGNVVTSYGYDGDSMRVRKVTPQGTQYFIHGAGSQLLAEYVGSPGGPALVREYIYLGSKLLASVARSEALPIGGFVSGVSASPQGQVIGTSVAVTVSGLPQPCSKVKIDFGDGIETEYTIASPYLLPFVVNHTYATPGMKQVVARGQAGVSGPCGGTVSTSIAVESGNIVVNGNFDQGLGANGLPVGWGMFSVGDPTHWSLGPAPAYGVKFYRTGNSTQAVVLQYTGLTLPKGAPLEITFRMGNTDTVRKRLMVLVHNAVFDDLAACSFWLNANQPFDATHTYTVRMHTTKEWDNATVAFYAADANAPSSQEAYHLGHVTMRYRPGNSSAKTDCVDPLAPDAQTPPRPDGAPFGNVLADNVFQNGLGAWTANDPSTKLLYGVYNETLEFFRLAGGQQPTISQVGVWGAPEDMRLTSFFELGNRSQKRQRVTIEIKGHDDVPMAVCTFWLEPGAPKRLYAMTTYARHALAAIKFVIVPSTATPPGEESAYAALLFDTVWLFGNGVGTTLGTECFEPGSFTIQSGLPGNPGLEAPPHPAVDSSGGPNDALAEGTDYASVTFETRGTEVPVVLEARAVPLTLGVGGPGSGTVTSAPVGLTCGGQGTCVGMFGEGSDVTLTAAPVAGSLFAGWTGDCFETTATTCKVNMLGAQQVLATFVGPPTLTFYHLDALGSIRAVTSSTTPYTVVKRHDYFPFGEDIQAPTGDPRRFAGKEIDPETNMHYFGARYYRNVLGRFTSVDPALDFSRNISDPQQWNRYQYARNNPLRYVDPDGRNFWDLLDFASAAVSLYELVTAPSWGNAGQAALDIGGAALPFIPSPGTIKRAAEVAESVGNAGTALRRSGDVGEQALKQLGGESQKYFKTSQGARYVDQFVDGVAHESKVGYASLTSAIKQQIAKDAELLKTGQVKGVTWHFFKSPKTGEIGASGALLDALKGAGIRVIFEAK